MPWYDRCYLAALTITVDPCNFQSFHYDRGTPTKWNEVRRSAEESDTGRVGGNLCWRFFGQLPTHGQESSREYQNAVGNSEFSRCTHQYERNYRVLASRAVPRAEYQPRPRSMVLNRLRGKSWMQERVGSEGANENPEGGFSSCTSKGKTCLRCRNDLHSFSGIPLCLPPNVYSFCSVSTINLSFPTVILFDDSLSSISLTFFADVFFQGGWFLTPFGASFFLTPPNS